MLYKNHLDVENPIRFIKTHAHTMTTYYLRQNSTYRQSMAYDGDNHMELHKHRMVLLTFNFFVGKIKKRR